MRNKINKLRVFEAFAGVGMQRMALKNLGIPHEVVAISEIDKFALASYMAIHGKTLNLGDITKIDVETIPEHDLFTYSFPCTDLSVSGKQLGFKKGSGTRSSLLWECERIIEHKRPKFLLLENVKALTFKKNMDGFNEWLEILESYGYVNHWKVLNAKDFGVPQNRERVFVVSIHNSVGDTDYEFPAGYPLTVSLQDILENEVDEKYYMKPEVYKRLVPTRSEYQPLLDNIVGKIKSSTDKFSQRSSVYGCVSGTLLASDFKQPKYVTTQVFKLKPSIHSSFQNGQRYKTYSPNGISPTLLTAQGGNVQPFVLNDFCIRKLTSREYWRLMGISDENYEAAKSVCSNTQLYKQAGNGIVVPVLEGIFSKLFLTH